MMPAIRVLALSGGIGGAKLALGLARFPDPLAQEGLRTRLVPHRVEGEHPADVPAPTGQAPAGEDGGQGLDVFLVVAAVHAAVIELDAAWEHRLAKLKTPADLVVSTARSLG